MKIWSMVRLSIIYCFYLLFLVGALLFGAYISIFYNHGIDFALLEQYSPGRPSIVLDEAGCEWARFQLDKREPIVLTDMPVHLINAFIAAEDWQFFSHCGISWRGVLRSIMVNCLRGRRSQGASTITQQLVRLLFFDAQKSFTRKIKEQICALLAEQQFTKEHILHMYLNHIYFGCGIYGVEAASQRFWGKSVMALEIHESATLAAIICAPNRYCPLLYPLSAQRRRDIVLGSMYKLGSISADEYTDALTHSVCMSPKKEEMLAPHLKESLRIQLEALVGKKMLYAGGLIIQTTLNKNMQSIAQRVFKRQITHLRSERHLPFDGGMLTIDTLTGAIKAYVGGYDFDDSKFDRVRLAERQIGSTFKVLIYAAAMMAGKKFTDTACDEPFSLVEQNGTTWSPRNYNRRFEGEMTLAYALSRSNNIVAIKTLLDVGIDLIIDLAGRAHLHAFLPPYPSLALGCVDATLLSVVGMFNIFANNGTYVEPYILVSIKDCWGNKLWKRSPILPEHIIDSRVAGQVTKVLASGMDRLYKFFPGRWPSSVEAISKTGTTNDSRTCWFMGSTPTVTTGVYIGCDDNRPMGKNIFPVHTAFPIWLDFNSAITHHRTQFVYDPALKEVVVDERTGSVVADGKGSSAMRVMVLS
jgi:penicillin-binding protein 1A